MTRINLVDPEELTDQHLVAEYREIFMVGSSLQRTLHSKRGYDPERIPKEFTLNGGHVMYFYNKGKYLYKRYQLLREEMIRRGMKPDPERKFKVDQFPPELFNDWTPSERDKNIVRERIMHRIAEKPDFYRHTGKQT